MKQEDPKTEKKNKALGKEYIDEAPCMLHHYWGIGP